VGRAPTSPSPKVDGEPVVPLTDKLVLACTTTARIELVGYRIGGAREPGRFCIDLVRVPEGSRRAAAPPAARRGSACTASASGWVFRVA
jgi:hypothetical protein